MDLESILSIRNVDRRIAAMAAQTGDVVANWQLREIDVSRSMVARRVDDGFMRRIGAHEFVVGPAALRASLDDRQRRGLAIVHAGRGAAALARGTASAGHQFLDRGDGTIHVVTNHRVRPLPMHGIMYHRSSSFSEADVIMVANEPTTRPHVTLVDLGFDHTRYQIARAMCAARDQDRFDRGKVEMLLEERRRAPGTSEVATALELLDSGCNGTRGRAEDYLLAGVLESERLPVPDVCNRRVLGIAGIEPDLAFMDVGLVVFADGRPHTWADVREKDQLEMQTLRDSGIVAIRFDNRRIWNERAQVVGAIEAQYAALRPKLVLPRRSRKVRREGTDGTGVPLSGTRVPRVSLDRH